MKRPSSASLQDRWAARPTSFYTEDVRGRLLRASRASLDRARVYNLHRSAVPIADW